jgi:hypothetical protein
VGSCSLPFVGFASELPSLERVRTNRSESIAVDFLELVVDLPVLLRQVSIEAAPLSFPVDGV